ncbi:MAG: cupin domain-containing protein, partial [Actinomycetota bacterium]|nr:cupin domain-containing protein [Actinomycetota bacterium]
VVEGEERLLRPWDFFHCPGGTGHVLVGAGDVRALVLAVGARGGRKGLVYPVHPAALARGAGVRRETTIAAQAYAPFPRPLRVSYGDGWLPDYAVGRPVAGQTAARRAPNGNGWFVVNVRDAPWVRSSTFGAACVFEDEETSFPDLGFTLGVLRPGQPSGLYHREANQEDFLVLAGECLALVEGEERPLRAWDLLHCPAGTDHILVGAGDRPSVVFATGARRGWPDKGIVYPRSELARRHGAGAETETSSPAEAYAPFDRWQPAPPETNGLPWA